MVLCDLKWGSRREPLLKKGTVTDLAGRPFKNITPYEYAYWAKDTHMCRMLERHMCETTKATMLACYEKIDAVGLTYEHHGKKMLHSKYFDFTPLKTALERFIMGYAHWVGTLDHDALNRA